MAQYVLEFEETADSSGEIRQARALSLPLPLRVLKLKLLLPGGRAPRDHLTTLFVDDAIVLEARLVDRRTLTRQLDLQLDRRTHSVFLSATGFSPGEVVRLRATALVTALWFDRPAGEARRLARKTDPDLEHRLAQAQPDDYLDVNAYLAEAPLVGEPDGGAAPRSPDELKRRAADAQRDLSAFFLKLSGVDAAPLLRASGHWITNAIGFEATRDVVLEVIERPEVERLDLERQVEEVELLDSLIELKGEAGPNRGTSWSVRQINAPRLWSLGIRGQGVLCALLDSGVDARHPDLAGRMWDGGHAFPHHGYNFAEHDDRPFDRQGHGTACAGLIAGDGSAGLATGVAPDAAILAVRIGGSQRSLWAGIEFAVDRGADVICLPLSWKLPSGAERAPWRRITAALAELGILLVCSIGNLGGEGSERQPPRRLVVPASCAAPWRHPGLGAGPDASSAIAVGATDSQDRLAEWSGDGLPGSPDGRRTGHGDGGLVRPDLCAPGVGTRSCDWRHGEQGAALYRSFSGTSAAAAHLAGCLCLLASAARLAGRPIRPERLQEALERTAVRIQGQTADKQRRFGAGRVDVFAAFRYGRQRDWW